MFLIVFVFEMIIAISKRVDLLLFAGCGLIGILLVGTLVVLH